MMQASFPDVASAYHDVLEGAVLGTSVEGHKGTDYERLGMCFEIRSPAHNLIAHRFRKFNYRYMIAEMLWNLCMTRQIEVLERVFPNVKRFVEDQPKWSRNMATWAYGPAMHFGVKEVLQELQKDSGSRRAVVTLGQPHSYEKTVGDGTPPCLVSVQWLIRDGKLHQITTMRSNDIWRGLPLDLYQFTYWQLMMAAHLKLEVGSYYHNVGSMHLYSRDRQEATDMFHKDAFVAIKSERPDKDALHYVLNHSDEVLGVMKSPEIDNFGNPLEYLLEAYHSRPTKHEFNWLRNHGYGVW